MQRKIISISSYMSRHVSSCKSSATLPGKLVETCDFEYADVGSCGQHYVLTYDNYTTSYAYCKQSGEETMCRSDVSYECPEEPPVFSDEYPNLGGTRVDSCDIDDDSLPCNSRYQVVWRDDGSKHPW